MKTPREPCQMDDASKEGRNSVLGENSCQVSVDVRVKRLTQYGRRGVNKRVGR